MRKKLIIVGTVILALILISFLYFENVILKAQIRMQHEKETISELKTKLDFTPFEKGLNSIGSERMKQIEALVIEKDIQAIQDEIMHNKVSCEEVLLFYIDRIKKNDKNYNTIISLNPKALDYAKSLDEKIKRGEKLGALFGVMVLVKDNISDMDMNTTAGAYALKDLKTSRDSFVVKSIKDQDGIVIGKNNLSEWANYFSTPSSNGFSVLGGQTKNAYGKFDVGGSSSGSASSAALNFCTISLGSETAGSIIYPSSQNSVVGVKPSLGILSRDLVIPISEAQDTVGVIGRNVSDVAFTLSTLSKFDENDKETALAKNVDLSIRSANDLNFKGKIIYMYKTMPFMKEQSIIKKEFEKLGAKVVDIDLSGSSDGVDISSVLKYGIVNDVAAYLNNPAVKSNFKSLKEIDDYNKEDEKQRAPFGMGLHENALKQSLSKEAYEKIAEKNRQISSKLIEHTLKSNNTDYIIGISNNLSAIYAPAGYPAVTVPSGYKSTGEPFGLTIVGKKGDDMRLLQLAQAYEKYTKHRVPPTLKKDK